MALQTRRVLPVRDGPAPIMFLTHCHHPFLFSTALQGDLLFLPARQRSTGLDHAISFKNHVETHSTGQLGGQFPSRWLEDHSLVICPACSLLISTTCHPTCNNPVSTFKERLPPDVDEVLATRVPLRTHIPKARSHLHQRHTGLVSPFCPSSKLVLRRERKSKQKQQTLAQMTAGRAMA